MRPRISTLRAALPTLALALVACGGGDAASQDPDALIQDGKTAAALEAIAEQKKTVEEGSEEHLELVLLEVKAQADEAPEAAKEAFLGFAGAHPDSVSPADFKYAVSELRTYSNYVEAIQVMDAGKKRWPEDAVMDELLAMLEKDAENDEGAANALKGLGYSSK